MPGVPREGRPHCGQGRVPLAACWHAPACTLHVAEDVSGSQQPDPTCAPLQVRKTMRRCSYVDIVRFMSAAAKQGKQAGGDDAAPQVRSCCPFMYTLSRWCMLTPCATGASSGTLLPSWSFCEASIY